MGSVPSLPTDWLSRIQNIFATNPVPTTPYPPKTSVLPVPPLASPIGHQESPGAGGAFFPGPVLPSGPQTFSNLQTGAPIIAPGGFGAASSRDIDVRQKAVQDQNVQNTDRDLSQQSGMTQAQIDQMRRAAFSGQQPKASKPKSMVFYGE